LYYKKEGGIHYAMSTLDDIEDNVLEQAASGVSSKSIGDRTYQYRNPKDTYDLLKTLQADSMTKNGPFLKVRFIGNK
jgi:hypothetical protein